MARALVAAAGFAVSGGAAADASDAVFVARVPDRYGRLLLAAVEPLDPSPRGQELAAVALRALRATFAATPGAAADALLAAFAAAHAALAAENHALAEDRSARRLGVGATAIALAGREIVVVQAPPAQALLMQDGQLYAFPDVASWRGDYVPDDAEDEAHPLGVAEYRQPRLYQSEAAPGDLIALCATGIGRVLARDEDAAVELYGGSLLTSDLEGSVDRLERLLAANDVADGFAVVAQIARLSGRPHALPRLTRRRAPANAPATATVIAATDVLPATTPDVNKPLSRLDGPSALWAAVGVRVAAGHDSDDPYSITSEPDDPRPRFEGLRDWAIELSEIASMQRGVRPIPIPIPAPARQRALAAPGAMSVQRYRDASGLPAEWRANLPRGPGLPFPARFLTLSLVLLLTLGGTGIAMGYQRDRAAHAAGALTEADLALRSAAENPGMVMAAVAEAEEALARAVAAGAGGEALASRQRELARVRDEAWGVRRLLEVERIGALPTANRDGPAHLALAGRTLYLAAGDLFTFDAEQRRLVLLLGRGDTVPGGTVGELRHVSIDGEQLVASDGEAMYARDELGGWQTRPLAVADVGGLRPDAPLVSWGEAAYGLSWEGTIVRFDGTTAGPVATRWADVAEMPDLETARDFAIDGRIHVLLGDGRVLTFSHGALAGTVTPFVVPLLGEVAVLADAPFATDFYLVDGAGQVGENTGRIVRVDAAGETVQYVSPPPGSGDPASAATAASLAGAQDVAIDELAGTVYWITSGELWQARLPAG